MSQTNINKITAGEAGIYCVLLDSTVDIPFLLIVWWL